MDEIVVKENIKIEDMIYEIRGKQVMMDSDLARLYECLNGTKDVNKAVKRNIERFPVDFYFQLTKEEYDNLKFQIGTSSLNNHGGVRKLPYVFTEHGVAMLSSVLRTNVASKVSIEIMRTFVAMRKYISTNLIDQKYYSDMIIRHDSEIKLLQESFRHFDEKKNTNEIYFNGQIYDAYSKILDIFKSAKEELIIIDGYADKTTLDIISQINVDVVLIVKTKKLLTKIDIEKYNKQELYIMIHFMIDTLY